MRLAPLLAAALTLTLPAAFAASAAPRDSATPLFELPAMTGIVEGFAFRARTGEFFFGDVHHRCVWRRDRDGRITRFSPPGDGLLGVFQLAVDEQRGLLWAATSMLAETAGCTDAQRGSGALVALDLLTGRLARTYPVPSDGREHVLGDLLLADDGTVFATDSRARIVWQLAPRAEQLAVFVESSAFKSLQGLALVAEGRTLIVSDYSKGLFVIDLATRTVQPCLSPTGGTLRGIDGLTVAGGDLIAVYNAAEPHRVLSLTLTADATAVSTVTELAAAPPGFNDLTLLANVEGHPAVIANSGWAAFEPGQPRPVPPRSVRVFRFGPPGSPVTARPD